MTTRSGSGESRSARRAGSACSNAGGASSNLYLGILGCTLATVCAYLLLLKYQKLIQQFSRDNVQLGERLGARTYALEKANEEIKAGPYLLFAAVLIVALAAAFRYFF